MKKKHSKNIIMNILMYNPVLVRTQIIQPPVDTRVLLGQTATLQCKISSDPAVPYQLDWFRDKQ